MTDKNISPRTELLEKCPVCESKNTKFFFSSPDRLHGIAGDFSYHRCENCQTIFQNPMVIEEDLHLCYPDDYFTHNELSQKNLREPVTESLEKEKESQGMANIRHQVRVAIINNQKKMPMVGIMGIIGKILSLSRRMREKAFFDHVKDELLPFSSGKLKALEIGCGAGHTLTTLQRVGWEVEGIEWDEKAAEVAKKHNNITIHTGDFLKIDLPKNSYNLIYLHHVFEHFREPQKVLQKFNELLVDNGRIVMVYPNLNSLGARIYKEHWFPWEVPRHLIIPSIKAISDVADKFNFKFIHKVTKSKEAAIFSGLSQMYKDNKPVTSTQFINLQNKDKLLKVLEGIGVFFGFDLGEEILIILKKS